MKEQRKPPKALQRKATVTVNAVFAADAFGGTLISFAIDDKEQIRKNMTALHEWQGAR